MQKLCKVVIIGSGPAGHTAAIYAARARLAPIMFEGFMAAGIAAGGQLTTTTEIENFPGFAHGISGPKLMAEMRQQAINCGAHIVTETINKVDLKKRPFFMESEDGTQIEADTVIVTTGATAKRMALPGEEKYWQKGVSACAVCDGALPIFRDNVLVVIGGGDSACEEAHYLTKFGKKIILMVRRGELRASKVMAERVLKDPKIEVMWNTQPLEIVGNDQVMTGIVCKDSKTGAKKTVNASGLFYAIGHQPNTDFLKGQLELDPAGYIITKPGTTQTSVPGVFAAGDVQDHQWRQAITAAGTGCMAALEAERWLSNHSHSQSRSH